MGNRLRGRSDLEPLWKNVYEHVASRILSGHLRGGDRISELRLAADTGVSRSPVREALGVLRAEGVLEHITGQGVRVRDADEPELREAFDVRRWLEAQAVAALATRGLPGGDLARLRESCHEMAAILDRVQADDPAPLKPAVVAELVLNDSAFHETLLLAAGNQRVSKIVLDTRMVIHASKRPTLTLTLEEATTMFVAHDGVLRAVQAREPIRARSLMLDHISWAERRMLAELRRPDAATRRTNASAMPQPTQPTLADSKTPDPLA
ncbi:MAG: GntR family transcriptional regulator [Planctomycetota bacterium]